MRWTGSVRQAFLMPAVIWVLIFTIFPLVYSLYAAFHKVESTTVVERVEVPRLNPDGTPSLRADGTPRTRTEVQRDTVTTWTFVGLDNFRRVFTDRQVREAVEMTGIFVAVAVTAEILLGLVLAFLFNREIYARGVLRAIIMLPIFATPVAVGYLFFTIFYEEGGPLGWTGIPFLSNPTWALISIIIVDIWQWTPFCFLVFLAALQGVPDELYEAARIDGASNLDMLLRVLLPLLQPTILIVLLLRLAEALKLFDVPFALTGGGPGIATQSYSFLAFRVGLRYFDLGYASAMAYVLLIVVMIIVTLFFRRLRETYG